MIEVQFYNDLCEAAKLIRQKVFVLEQGFVNEFDDIDDKAIHLVLYNDQQAVATARMFTENDPECFTIGRVAVLKDYRGMHLGAKIMQYLEEEARLRKGRMLKLSAQCSAQSFYEKQGFLSNGEVFLDEECPHIQMVKKLS